MRVLRKLSLVYSQLHLAMLRGAHRHEILNSPCRASSLGRRTDRRSRAARIACDPQRRI